MYLSSLGEFFWQVTKEKTNDGNQPVDFAKTNVKLMHTYYMIRFM